MSLHATKTGFNKNQANLGQTLSNSRARKHDRAVKHTVSLRYACIRKHTPLHAAHTRVDGVEVTPRKQKQGD